MPKPSLSPRRPEDFAQLLNTAEPVLLVGGQAVNLWALYFGDATADLAPFVSADADILGNRETLTELGEVAHTRPQFFPLKPPSNEIGVISTLHADGHSLLIEVLRSVHGVSDQELKKPAYLFELGEAQTRVLVPGPVALLRAKVANTYDLDQTGRQDLRHVKILARVLPLYLRQLQDTIPANDSGPLTERVVLDLLELLLKLLRERKTKAVFKQIEILRSSLFENLIVKTTHPKIARFLTERLPRLLK